MVAGLAGVPLAGGRRRRRWPEPARIGAVALGVGGQRSVGCRRPGQPDVDRRTEELEHQPARVADPLRVGLDLHPGLDLARAGRSEDARPGDLDDADPADVDRGQVLEIAQGRRVDPLGAAGIEDRRAGGDADRHAVDRQLDRLHRRAPAAPRAACWPGRRAEQDRVDAHRLTSPGWRKALSMALEAVWPRPQIEASRIAWPTSRRRASSSAAEPLGRPAASRARISSWRTDADPARDALAARLVAEERGDPAERTDQVGGLVEDHHDARPERRPDRPRALERERRVERVGPDEDAGRPAEQDRLDRPARPARRRRARAARAGWSRMGPRRRRVGRRCPDRQNSFGPVEPSVPIAANAAPPSRTIAGMLASVSTLLTVVGLPNSPTSTGNGGLLRGSPRLPSIDSNRAVSSPQM